MKANELRIGNYVGQGVLHTGIGGYDHYTITALYELVMFFKESNAGEYYKDVQPIPLTEEWLLKFGFKKWNKIYPEAFSLDVLKTDFYLRPCYKGGFYWGFNLEDKLDCELNDAQPITYIHQLQNLYFALTGEELCKI